MWWKIIVEVLIVAAILVTGGSFWACVKSSKHLSHFLSDIGELQRLIDYIGPAKIAEESSGIEPIFGSYAKNIETFERIHLASLRQTATMVIRITSHHGASSKRMEASWSSASSSRSSSAASRACAFASRLHDGA